MERKHRRSQQTAAKMALVADSDDEGSYDEGPEDVKFGQEREKAEERKQERMAALNR